MEHRELVERYKALEKEYKERCEGRGDGGSGSAGMSHHRTFTRKGRGALMFKARPSRSSSRATVDDKAPEVQHEGVDEAAGASSSSLIVAPGESEEDDAPEIVGCWEGTDVASPSPPKQPAMVPPWWASGWGAPGWMPPYFPWGPLGISSGDNPWVGFGRFARQRGSTEGDKLKGWPSWEEIRRLAQYGEEDEGPEDRPYGSIDLPLGGHLAMAVKEKIWRGEYVDLFSLLHSEPERVPRVGEPERDVEATRKRKIDRNWTNWLYGYCIYMAVVVQLKPKKAPALIKYLDIVHRTFRDFGGQAWLQYDQNFRLRAANDPAMSWSVPKFELWMQVVATAKPVQGDRSDSGHLIARNAASQLKASSGASGVQSRRICYEFNTSGTCSRVGCLFPHVCAICGGKHSATTCFRGKGSKPPVGRGGPKGGGGPPALPAPGKGAQPD